MLMTTSRTPLTFDTSKLLAAGPAQDVVRDACRAYNDLVERDYRTLSATADEWFAVARKLSSAAELLTGERQYFVSSRATDAELRGRKVLLVHHCDALVVAQSFAI